ncbi:MAG: hypothetical protein AAFP17_03155 [Pseudomonadota bacterium]
MIFRPVDPDAHLAVLRGFHYVAIGVPAQALEVDARHRLHLRVAIPHQEIVNGAGPVLARGLVQPAHRLAVRPANESSDALAGDLIGRLGHHGIERAWREDALGNPAAGIVGGLLPRLGLEEGRGAATVPSSASASASVGLPFAMSASRRRTISAKWPDTTLSAAR